MGLSQDRKDFIRKVLFKRSKITDIYYLAITHTEKSVSKKWVSYNNFYYIYQ
jgi:hypothetical protein